MVYEEFAERGGRVTLLKLSIFFKKKMGIIRNGVEGRKTLRRRIMTVQNDTF